MPLTPSDHIEAARFIREEYEADPAVCRVWLRNQRENLLRQAAVAAMQKRQDAEHKAVSNQERSAAA